VFGKIFQSQLKRVSVLIFHLEIMEISLGILEAKLPCTLNYNVLDFTVRLSCTRAPRVLLQQYSTRQPINNLYSYLSQSDTTFVKFILLQRDTTIFMRLPNVNHQQCECSPFKSRFYFYWFGWVRQIIIPLNFTKLIYILQVRFLLMSTKTNFIN